MLNTGGVLHAALSYRQAPALQPHVSKLACLASRPNGCNRSDLQKTRQRQQTQRMTPPPCPQQTRSELLYHAVPPGYHVGFLMQQRSIVLGVSSVCCSR